MSRTIKLMLFGLLFSVGLISCEKEYSVENGTGLLPGSGGTAVYTFDGAPGACTTPVINGNYQQGSPLGSGNTIVLTVDVTTAGTYTISTGTVNGVSFSVTSSFSTTGPQIIQLTGSGTPTAAGTFNYTPGTSGCAFSVTFASSGGSASGTAVYTCTNMTANGTYTKNTALDPATNTLTINVNVMTAGTYTVSTATSDGMTFSGSGTLALGAQTITLAGSGTPIEAGTGTQITVTFGSCTVNITVADVSGGGTDYLRCKLNGSSTVTTFNTNLAGAKDAPAPGFNTLEISGDGASNSSLDLLLSIMGTLGTVDYTAPITGTKSVLPLYTDESGVSWSNVTGPNTFKVTISNITPTRVTGTFSGTLYPTTGGTGTVAIAGGEFNLPYQ
jgi:hypothetical protein